ncbi:hypothetical protein SESBI_21348 [Sesbania bispinosa]|nr:hypothetical protein SESBI_21348 [Sesbania bispinosa]
MNVVENEGGTTAEPVGELSRTDMPRVAAEDIDMVEDDYSSDDSAKDVHFDDSEEERVLGDDDGFELTDIGEAEAALNQQLEGMKMKSIVEEQETFVPPNVSGMHDIEEDYTSEELDSGASDIDGTSMPNKCKRCGQLGHIVPPPEEPVAAEEPAVACESPPTNVAPTTAGKGQPTNVEPAATAVIAKQPRLRGRPRATAASKTGTTATASTSNCGKQVTKKSGKAVNQDQPYVPPGAWDKSMASLLTNLVTLNNIWTDARKNGVIPSSQEIGEPNTISDYERILQVQISNLRV